MADEREAVKQRLIDAALRLFTKNGYRETSLREVAKRAKVSYGSIGYHFSSKRALYDATVQRFRPEAIASYFPDVPDAAEMTREQAVELFREFVTTLVSIKAKIGENPHVAISYIEGEGVHGGAPNPSFYKKVIDPGHSALRRLIEAIRPDIEDDLVLEALTFNVISQCLMLRIGRGILLKRTRRRTLSPEDVATIARAITEVAIRGFEGAEF